MKNETGAIKIGNQIQTMNQNTETWEERFDNKFPCVYADKAEDWEHANVGPDIILFIRTEIDRARQETVDYIKNNLGLINSSIFEELLEAARQHKEG